ncbi:class I SAM-dependent methyltransferase [Pseudonocardia sp. TRM90224]|uniref:class I SAM-dependent methyltransferase n=1 Tax=Pseudonocardia sp. TRM90224 TaxID=2812678 RepID=UPI002102E9A5|nr:methyltransferase domain-containing protein [Pseudonocardia sp. TRM90224]
MSLWKRGTKPGTTVTPRGTTRPTKRAAWHRQEVAGLLGPGSGLCLDLCCGTGQYVAMLDGTGRQVVGLDRSIDQLRIAQRRAGPLIQGDAAQLPFADGTFDLVTAMWISTDVDDFAAVVAESARVLRPGGTLLIYGVHPCFNGPCVEGRDDGGQTVHPGYRIADWHREAPWWRPDGIRRRVGMRHVPLADLFMAVLAAGFVIERVGEHGAGPLPNALALTVRLPGRDGPPQRAGRGGGI